jgi:hypothetical protein
MIGVSCNSIKASLIVLYFLHTRISSINSSACKKSSSRKLKGGVLNGGVFLTLKGARIVINNWPQKYNTLHPHSRLDGLPPAPEAFLPFCFPRFGNDIIVNLLRG